MVKKKSKVKTIFISMLVIAMLLLVIGFVSQSNFKTPSYVFNDKELGMVVFTADTGFTEQAYFSKRSSGVGGVSITTVGENIYICDVSTDLGDDWKYSLYQFRLQKNGNTYKDFDLTSWANSLTSLGVTKCMRWSPTVAANRYEAYTLTTWCPDIYGPIYQPDCTARDSRDVKRYYLQVNSKEDACNKDRYTGDWYIAERISNGQVLRANVYYVDNDCDYYVERYSEQTQCNDGYVIEGSTLTVTSGDGWDCVSASSGSDDEDIIDSEYCENLGMIYSSDINSCVDPICNEDLIVNCGDGTSIVSKQCEHGLYFDTVAECSEIGPVDPDCISDVIVDCDDGTSIVSKACIDGLYIDTQKTCVVTKEKDCTEDLVQICDNGNSIISKFCIDEVYYETDNKCTEDISFFDKYSVLLGLSGLLFVIIIFVIIFFDVGKKKK